MGKFADFIIDECNICRIDCNITSNSAHGNSYIRLL